MLIFLYFFYGNNISFEFCTSSRVNKFIQDQCLLQYSNGLRLAIVYVTYAYGSSSKSSQIESKIFRFLCDSILSAIWFYNNWQLKIMLWRCTMEKETTKHKQFSMFNRILPFKFTVNINILTDNMTNAASPKIYNLQLNSSGL